jgi:Cellulase (glycosyl hydrolase family 5)
MMGDVIAFLGSCNGSTTGPASKGVASPKVAHGYRIAPGLPVNTISMNMGVDIRLSSPQQRDVRMIATAGFGFVRMDLPWASIERQKGIYDFAGYEDLVRMFAGRGIRSLIILAYGNPLYDNSPAPFHMGPRTDEVRQAFARYAAATVAKFKGLGVIWEIWNEPNNPEFWDPSPSADEYVELVKVTVGAIRHADAHATIIAPAVVTFLEQYPDAWSYLGRCFTLGLLELVDAVSIHPYRSQVPETVSGDYQRLHSLMGKANLPIIASEWGYPVLKDLPQASQAALFARKFLTNTMNRVPLSIWYDWRDDSPDAQNLQDNFGIVTWDYQSKVAYRAAQTLTKELGGFHFVQRLSLASQGDYATVFAHDTMKKLALWTVDDPHTISLSVDTPAVTVVSMTGETHSLTTTKGTLMIELTGSPQYLQLA